MKQPVHHYCASSINMDSAEHVIPIDVNTYTQQHSVCLLQFRLSPLEQDVLGQLWTGVLSNSSILASEDFSVDDPLDTVPPSQLTHVLICESWMFQFTYCHIAIANALYFVNCLGLLLSLLLPFVGRQNPTPTPTPYPGTYPVCIYYSVCVCVITILCGAIRSPTSYGFSSYL